jgi:hypothetical protein
MIWNYSSQPPTSEISLSFFEEFVPFLKANTLTIERSSYDVNSEENGPQAGHIRFFQIIK